MLSCLNVKVKSSTYFFTGVACFAEIELWVLLTRVYRHFSPPFLQFSSLFHVSIWVSNAFSGTLQSVFYLYYPEFSCFFLFFLQFISNFLNEFRSFNIRSVWHKENLWKRLAITWEAYKLHIELKRLAQIAFIFYV